jgi:Uma2 family endonuclease
MDDQHDVLTAPPPTVVQTNKKLDLSHLITEDDEPVDNFASAKQQRFFVEPLYSSSKLPRPFLADSNVAIYGAPYDNPIVPDMFLSQGVQVADDWWEKENRSYLLWEFHKPPEVVVEMVSNQKGNEDGSKLHDYAKLGIHYYVIYDPQRILSGNMVRVYQLVAGEYLLRPDYRLAEAGLSLTLWYGDYEDKKALWLRWCDLEGGLILTGAERATQAENHAEQERVRAEQERVRAEQEQARAEQERIRAEQADALAQRLAAQLRALGVEPEA